MDSRWVSKWQNAWEEQGKKTPLPTNWNQGVKKYQPFSLKSSEICLLWETAYIFFQNKYIKFKNLNRAQEEKQLWK